MGVASCKDTAGNYSCVCSSGFTYDSSARTCTGTSSITVDFVPQNKNYYLTALFKQASLIIFFFKDVNECSSTSTNNCDVTGRATCTNTPGSFTCACKPGFQGAGTAGTCKGNLVIYLNYSGLVLLCKNLPLMGFCFSHS